MLYQNDASGKTHLKGIKVGLEKYGVKMVAAEGYEPKEVDRSSQVIKMQQSGAQAVICSSAPEPGSQVLHRTQEARLEGTGRERLLRQEPEGSRTCRQGSRRRRLFFDHFPGMDGPAEQIQQAKSILAKYYPQETPDAVHLWGFTGAQVFTEALKRMGKDISRAKLLDTLEGIDNWKGSVVPVVNIGEVGKDEPAIKHLLVSGMSYVVYKGGKFEPFTPPWLK